MVRFEIDFVRSSDRADELVAYDFAEVRSVPDKISPRYDVIDGAKVSGVSSAD